MKNFDENLKNYSVLIADDNPNNLKVLGTMLEKIGYNVRVATNGENALNSIKRLPPDLILLDIHMPVMDGYEVCKIIKKDPVLKDIPVIFLSALTEAFNKVQGFKVGAIDYITKPFEIEEVQIRIYTHIKLREKTSKLELALKELNEKEEQLIQTEKMAALGILTSGIAHEINNPINFISNSVKALKERTDKLIDLVKIFGNMDSSYDNFKILAGDIPEIFNNIMEGIDYITKIVKGLRIYSRIDKDLFIHSDINELIDSSLLILYHKYKDKVTIEKKYGDLPKLMCHPAKLSQVFINIISNAIDSIEEMENRTGKESNGLIKIISKLNEDNNSICIEFIDNGTGIKDEIKNKIFDPFFTTKEVNKGTGLGLSICSSIIKEHNGIITAENNNNKGTKFIIILPIKEEA